MICSSQSQSSTTISSDSLLRAPVQRYRVPKRIPTFLDLNQKPKKEKFISFELVSKLDTLQIPLRPSNESVSTTDEEHDSTSINKEEVFTPMNGVVVSILDIISHKVSFDNDNKI